MNRFARTMMVLLFSLGAFGLPNVRGQGQGKRIAEYPDWSQEAITRRAQERDAIESLRIGPYEAGMGGRRRDPRDPAIFFPRRSNDWLEQHEKLLRPEKADREAFKTFLKQPNTGLARVLNDRGLESDKVVRVEYLDDNHARLIPGGGSFYSFTKLNHAPGKWAELKLIDGEFVVGFAERALGILTIVGDVPLESVAIDNPEINVLAKYAPPTAYERAKAERPRLKAGLKVGNNLYKARLPIQVNTTYALRSIAFDRSDILVAFRVVRQETDGSVLLLWKRLHKFPKPKLTGAPKK
jgi:hypothetical protein